MAGLIPSTYDVESPTKGAGQGQVQVIFGPMFSGKTTELIRRLRRYQVSKHRCLIIKYAKDTRYSNGAVSTHDVQTMAAVAATELSPLRSIAAQAYSVVGIDEGQFFPDCVSFAEEMANLGKIVIVAALDATFQRQGFGNILQLVPLAEHVVKLNAVCMECFRSASFTKRKGEETEVEVIGGQDKYMSVCRKCYHGPRPANGALSPVKKALFSENGATSNGHAAGEGASNGREVPVS